MANIKNRRSVLVLFCVLLSVFLLLLSYKIVLIFTGLAAEQEQVFSFLEGKGELQTGFTEPEISHLEDVKKVMKYAEYLFYALLLAVTAIITYYRKDKNYVFQLLHYGGKVTVAAVLLIGVLSLLSFDYLFTVFHELFFPQGNWQFSADSLLIQTFPLEFFMMIARKIFLLTLFLGILFILSGYFYRYVLRHRH